MNLHLEISLGLQVPRALKASLTPNLGELLTTRGLLWETLNFRLSLMPEAIDGQGSMEPQHVQSTWLKELT